MQWNKSLRLLSVRNSTGNDIQLCLLSARNSKIMIFNCIKLFLQAAISVKINYFLICFSSFVLYLKKIILLNICILSCLIK